jgi:hypothetical protein
MRRVTWKQAVAGLALLASGALLAPAVAEGAARSPGGPGGHPAWNGGWTWISLLGDQLAAIFHVGDPGVSDHGALTRKSPPGANLWGAAPTGGSMIDPDGQPR